MWKVACGLLVLCVGCGRLQFDATADAAGDGAMAVDAPVDGSGRVWWNSAWTRRIKLRIDNTAGPELANFPVLVTMDPTRITYADALPTGADVRFLAEDHATPLAFDIERWGSGTSAVWVRIPRIAPASTYTFFLYYGNAGASSASSAFSTWAGHSLVWHLAQTPTGAADEIADSSPSANPGTTQGGMPAGAQQTGVIGGALTFDGTDDWITAPNSVSLMRTGSLTIQMWINVQTARNQWLCDFVESVTEQEAGNHLYELSINGSDNLELQWEYGAGNDEAAQSTVPLATPAGQWALLGVTRNAETNTVTFYENGTILGAPVPYTNDATGGTTSILYLAGEVDNTSSKQPFAGRIDEVRILPDWLTPARMNMDYRSMTDALISYGAAEAY